MLAKKQKTNGDFRMRIWWIRKCLGTLSWSDPAPINCLCSLNLLHSVRIVRPTYKRQLYRQYITNLDKYVQKSYTGYVFPSSEEHWILFHFIGCNSVFLLLYLLLLTLSTHIFSIYILIFILIFIFPFLFHLDFFSKYFSISFSPSLIFICLHYSTHSPL